MHSESDSLSLLHKKASMTAKHIPEYLKKPKEITCTVRYSLPWQGTYIMFLSSELCVLVNCLLTQGLKNRTFLPLKLCLTCPLSILLFVLGILSLPIISKVVRSMAKPYFLKNVNIILIWEELVAHMKKKDLIKFGNTVNKLFVTIIWH